jgi:LAO/AO transport system kinase
MVDFFLLIQIAGAGDELQGIKRGIMEMADGIVINKADGDNADEARRAAVHYRNALQLFPMPVSGFRPEVLTYSGFYDLDIDKVWGMVVNYINKVRANGSFEERRRFQQRYWMYEAINEQLKSRFYNTEGMEELLSRYEQLLLQGKTTSFAAANKVLDFYDKAENENV